jgi:N utilization substance protein A
VDRVRLVDPDGHHAHVLVPPDQLSLAIGREGQNVRLAARLTGWKIDIKNANEYDQGTEDATVANLISLRQEEEALQAEADARLAAEQAARAAEDARLRELYPLPEDEEDEYEAPAQPDAADPDAEVAEVAEAESPEDEPGDEPEEDESPEDEPEEDESADQEPADQEPADDDEEEEEEEEEIG